MNRIQPLIATPKPRLHEPDVSAGRYAPGQESLPHLLFMPLHYAANYAYPLIVWLHGPQDDESQLQRIMPLVSLRNFAAVAPRGTVTCSASGGRPAGYGWSQQPGDVLHAQRRVFECLQRARQQVNVHPRRIFLAGYDSGGTMAYRLAMSHPEQFAGVVSLLGPFPRGRAPLARLAEARRVPLLICCGRRARRYAPHRVCQDLRLFHAAGLCVSLRQYPSADELTPLMLADVNRWIMEQVLGGN